MPLHVVFPLFVTFPILVESSLFVHLLQVALTTLFLVADEMALIL